MTHICPQRSTDDVVRINFRFRFWSHDHLRVVLFCVNIFIIQYGDISGLRKLLIWPPSAILDLLGVSCRIAHEAPWLFSVKKFIMLGLVGLLLMF